MSDPSQIEPESLVKGGGVVGTLLLIFKWVFTTGVGEVKTDVRELKVMMNQMSKDITGLTTALAVATKDAISRKEFEELDRKSVV